MIFDRYGERITKGAWVQEPQIGVYDKETYRVVKIVKDDLQGGTWMMWLVNPTTGHIRIHERPCRWTVIQHA